LNTGGANYFFTRIASSSFVDSSSSIRIVWSPKVLRRLDAISRSGDTYGETNHFPGEQNYSEASKKRFSTTHDFKNVIAKKPYNETMFKNSIELFDGLNYIYAGDKKKQVIQIFKDHGFSVLPDGRKIEEVIRGNGN
jgi:hypothetical protein